MTRDQFHNALRIIRSIDSHELGDPPWWPQFRDVPFEFFIRCDDESADKIWNVILKRSGGADLGDHVVPPIRMDQTAAVLAMAARAAMASFSGEVEGESEEDATKRHYAHLAVFLHQFGQNLKHPKMMAGIFRAVADEIAANPPPTDGADPTTTELLKPRGNGGVVSPNICFDALLLAGDVDMDMISPDSWTQVELDRAYDWAMRVHLHASDNDDVPVPPRPHYLPRGTTP